MSMFLHSPATKAESIGEFLARPICRRSWYRGPISIRCATTTGRPHDESSPVTLTRGIRSVLSLRLHWALRFFRSERDGYLLDIPIARHRRKKRRGNISSTEEKIQEYKGENKYIICKHVRATCKFTMQKRLIFRDHCLWTRADFWRTFADLPIPLLR